MKSKAKKSRSNQLILILGPALVVGWLWSAKVKPQKPTLYPLKTATATSAASPPNPSQKMGDLSDSLRKSQKTEPRAKLEILREILGSKNDNDPRLDSEFKKLSVQEKEAFIKEYSRLAQEARNERGTIVFLIGRNLTSPQDFAFFRQVLTEPACQDLKNCSSSPEEIKTAHSSEVEVTLAYPQLMALHAISSQFEHGNTHPELLNLLKTASQSSVSPVKRMADSILDLLPMANKTL